MGSLEGMKAEFKGFGFRVRSVGVNLEHGSGSILGNYPWGLMLSILGS